MLHNMMLGRYYPVRSKIHAMNPIAKILCILIFIVTTFFSVAWQLNVFLIVFTFLFLLLTGIPLIEYLKTVKIFIPLYLILLIIGTLFHVSLLDNCFLMIRITLVLFYFIMLTLTTPMTEIVYGLETILGFLKIFGFNVSKIALSITEVIRFFPNLIDVGNQILKSAASRGIDYHHSNIFTKFLILKSMSASIFELTIKKSEDIKSSMILRLYQNGKRTNFRMNSWKVFDTYMVMMYVLMLVVVIKKELMG